MAATSELTPSRIVRWAMGAATIVSAVVGYAVHDARFYVASGAFGTIWTAWDLFMDFVVGPATELLGELLGQGGGGGASDMRPTLDDTIRLLEHHLERGASPSVEIEAAIRLAEIYRTVKHDPERARDVIARVRARHPSAQALASLPEG
jgi:hypothetical protein